MKDFVHLHTHTHYSLLDGMSKIGELVEKAKELGMKSLAITDHGNLYGAVEFYKACKSAGIKPILGVEAYVASKGHKEKNGSNREEQYHHLILLVKNETGWKNLLKLVTKSHLDGFYYKPRMDKEMLREHSEGLIALSACLGGELARALASGKIEQAEKVALSYSEIFGKDNYYIEVGHHPQIEESNRVFPLLINLAKKLNLPIVATQDSHYLNKEDRPVHDILLAIQTGQTLDTEDRFCLEDDFHFASSEEMSENFKDYPQAIENTLKIADSCDFEMELGKILLPKFETPNKQSANEYLRELIKERVGQRYEKITKEVQDRIDYELSVIEKTGFADYFLIVQDFINWAKERGVVVGPGRGSAAGSIVSYILNITDLDPIKYELLFERFLNPERIQMPDIDIDFTDTRRDEVFAYLEEKYGADRVAHIITFGTMAARAGVRDVGRALGVPYSFCDKLAKLIPTFKTLDQALKIVPELSELYKKDENAKKIIDAARRLEGVARHASVHACGTVVSAEPLVNRVPLQLSPQKNNIVITQFEMHSIEDLGLLKIDILGLKNLTIIEDTLKLVRDLKGEDVDIGKIPLDDKPTFKLLQSADTTGVFQLESGGMRRYLKELKPTELEDIIAMVSLYRPGPMELIPSYIARKHGKEKVSYLHPRLEPILKNTYGIGIYQEQMMRIASDLAGFSLPEADTLRKAIGKKIKKLLDEQEKKLVQRMIAGGIPEKTARAIWELFPPFARYGFNRSHAASYAIIAYRTAYLKAHYPIEFMTALLNADSGDVDRISFLVGEAKKMKIEVLPPDINKSSAIFTPDGSDIRFGLAAIKNVGNNIVEAIIAERQKAGPFESFESFISRVNHKDLNKKSLESLTKCGALDSLGVGRNQVLENMEEIIKFNSALKKNRDEKQDGLFGSGYAPKIQALKMKSATPAPLQQRLAWEKELLGLYISDHPLNANGDKLKKLQPTAIAKIKAEKSGAKNYRIAGLITSVKKIITKANKPMAFAKIEDESDSIELVVFSDVFEKNKDLWQDGKCVVLVGKLSFRNGELSMVVAEAREV